jgi:hypothetical protein
VKIHQQVVWRRWSVTKLASITFLSLAFSYWIDHLGFTTKGRLAAVLIIPSLGVPNWSVIYIINTAPSSKFSGAVAIEARKGFDPFNMLGSHVKVVGTTKEDFKVPIPCKLVGMHEALEKNFNWICPEKLFDESSLPKHDHKGSQKLIWTQFNLLLKRLLQLILMPLSKLLDLHFLRLAQRR